MSNKLSNISPKAKIGKGVKIESFVNVMMMLKLAMVVGLDQTLQSWMELELVKIVKFFLEQYISYSPRFKI